jgi:hypothetical protein
MRSMSNVLTSIDNGHCIEAALTTRKGLYIAVSENNFEALTAEKPKLKSISIQIFAISFYECRLFVAFATRS